MKVTEEQLKKLFDMLNQSLLIDDEENDIFSMNREERIKLWEEIFDGQKDEIDLPWK